MITIHLKNQDTQGSPMSRQLKFECMLLLGCVAILLSLTSIASATDENGGENASNPLALPRFRYFKLALV